MWLNMSSQGFFSQFSNFEHDSTKPLLVEFQRLSLHRNWKAGGKAYRQNRQKCLTQEFEHHYGQVSEKLAGWQALCVVVHISPRPLSITQCKKMSPSYYEYIFHFWLMRRDFQALSNVAVNIVDLIDARRIVVKVRLFSFKAALRNYFIKHEKIFPIKQAKTDGFRAALLIKVF